MEHLSVHKDAWLDGASWKTGVGSIHHTSGSKLPRVMSRADIFLNASWRINLTPGGKTQASFAILRIKLLTLTNTLLPSYHLREQHGRNQQRQLGVLSRPRSHQPWLEISCLHLILLMEVILWNEPGCVVVSPTPLSCIISSYRATLKWFSPVVPQLPTTIRYEFRVNWVPQAREYTDIPRCLLKATGS